ncbi:MAG: glycosyltransferase family 2 protein [Humibacillus sp.]|nr:glycosyltransferase family 2 protein [Humibacillus sp.]
MTSEWVPAVVASGTSAPGAVADSVHRISVVVPARNEEALVGRCLDSLEAAVERLHLTSPDVAVDLVVVLDACTDGTARVVEAHPGVTVLEIDAARVGAARQAGIRLVVDREHVRAATGHDDVPDGDPAVGHWVANTDADSTVPASWLLDQLAFARGGHDVVVGVALPDPAELSPEVHVLWNGLHRLVEGHEHVHGANLSFRLSTYLAAGGFEPLRVHEDVRLVERMRALGARVTATAQVRVRTSGRTTGRAPHGFAAYLEDLTALAGAPPDHDDERAERTA